MAEVITVQKTPQGLLIPSDALGDWRAKEFEAVWDKCEIVIRIKSTPADERARVRQTLRAAEMLYEPRCPPPFSRVAGRACAPGEETGPGAAVIRDDPRRARGSRMTTYYLDTSGLSSIPCALTTPFIWRRL